MERFTVLKEQGKQHLLSKSYKSSISCYSEASKALKSLDPQILMENKIILDRELAILETNVGLNYFEQKMYDQALQHFRMAQDLDRSYDKAHYRTAVCLERLGEHADALLAAKKISAGNSDKDVVALQTRLMRTVTQDNNMKIIMPKLRSFLAQEHIEEVTLLAKDGPDQGKTTKQTRYNNEKEIEYALLMMAKGVEEGAQLFDLVLGLHEFYDILKTHDLKEWQTRLSHDIYLRLLATISLIFESLSARDTERTYMLLTAKEMATTQERFCCYLWDQYVNHNAGKDVKELLAKYPLFLTNISLLNTVSIWLKIGTDKMCIDDAEFFLNVIYNRAKAIKDCKSDTVKNLEKATLEEESKKFSEFVERISKVNSKASKSFLVTFFKAVNTICGFEIYKLLFKNVAHLYRDNFSFQSILLMNSLLLSSYPSILETFIKQEPLFLPSVSNLAQHLHFMLQEGNYSDSKVQFKLENTFQLLFLCLSNKPFLTAISSSQSDFRSNLKKFLEVSYQLQEELPPQIVAKSLVCTAVTIMEVFPVLFGL
jgi:tetratricopeptide (TPR) repeat protein